MLNFMSNFIKNAIHNLISNVVSNVIGNINSNYYTQHPFLGIYPIASSKCQQLVELSQLHIYASVDTSSTTKESTPNQANNGKNKMLLWMSTTLVIVCMIVAAVSITTLVVLKETDQQVEIQASASEAVDDGLDLRDRLEKQIPILLAK